MTCWRKKIIRWILWFAGKYLEYRTSCGSCIHNHLPFISVSRKVPVISFPHFIDHTHIDSRQLCFFLRKILPGNFSKTKHMAVFSHPCFAHPQISRHPSIPMPKWTWWDGDLNLSMGGKFHPTRKHVECQVMYSSMENWILSRCGFLLKKGGHFYYSYVSLS